MFLFSSVLLSSVCAFCNLSLRLNLDQQIFFTHEAKIAAAQQIHGTLRVHDVTADRQTDKSVCDKEKRQTDTVAVSSQ